MCNFTFYVVSNSSTDAAAIYKQWPFQLQEEALAVTQVVQRVCAGGTISFTLVTVFASSNISITNYCQQ